MSVALLMLNSPLERSVNARVTDSPFAWRMAGAAFVICFVVFGVVYSFGAFFKPMGAEFGANRASTSAIFSITAAVYSLIGLAGGRLHDRFGPRRVMLVGAFALGAGLLATARVDSLPAAYLTYGLGVGAGVGCTYVPALAVVGGWFTARRRNTAMAIAVSGIGAGTLAFAPLAAAMIRRFGWRESYKLLGVASMLILLACAWIAEAAPPPAVATTPRPISHIVRSREFALLYAGALLCSVAIYVPFVYLPAFAQSRGITDVAAATLVGIIGAASLVGRLSFGPLANRLGIFALYKVSLLILGLSYAIWPVAHSYSALILFAIVMGSAYGGMVSLSPTVVAELFGIEGLGTILGALYTCSALSALAGPPLVGWAIDRGGSYLWAAATAGGTGVASFGVLLLLREPGASERALAQPALAPQAAPD